MKKIIKRTKRTVPVSALSMRRFLSRRWPLLAAMALLGGVIFTLWVFLPYWRVLGQFSQTSTSVPSRIYERPPRLAQGQRLSSSELERLLSERGYRPASSDALLHPGEYQKGSERTRVYLRSFPTPAGWTQPLRVDFRFRGTRLAGLEMVDGATPQASPEGTASGRSEKQRIEAAWLDPLLIRSFFGPDGGDRWPVRVEDLPDHLIRSVLAAEDARFFDHGGVSVRGILRAFFSNLRGASSLQGGSTLTQQLVKNLYLSPERRLSRKIREAFLALYLELRYEKPAILQAYLNEIYLGRRGTANLMGVGAASRTFFGIPPEELDLSQSAALAGMIQSPANLAPDLHLEESQVRRDWVLDRLLALEWIDAEAHQQAKAQPLVTRQTSAALSARYAADAILEELEKRFAVEDIGNRGFVVLSTLDGNEQRAAESAVRDGLNDLAKRVRKSGDAPLQGALVAADPRDGSIRAWVGGRDYGESQFDRVRQAKRQVGSAFKPVILAAAFSERSIKPSDLIVDEPLTLELDGKLWSPRNSDGEFRGEISVRRAIEESVNIPAVKLALQVGLDKVVAWGRRLGVESPLRPLPSLALGAFEMSPLELLGVYATLANEGRRPQLHLIEGVLDPRGEPLRGQELEKPQVVLEPAVAFLVTSVLEGVVERGTGAGLRRMGYEGAVAAKSGTTNDRRDAWFAGYTPAAVAVVWVGYDEPAATGLSGTSGALPILGAFLKQVRPAGGYGIFRQPPGVTTRTIDPATGGLATGRCYNYVTETFLEDDVPTEECWLHSDAHEEERRGFWRRLFGRNGQNREDDGNNL